MAALMIRKCNSCESVAEKDLFCRVFVASGRNIEACLLWVNPTFCRSRQFCKKYQKKTIPNRTVCQLSILTKSIEGIAHGTRRHHLLLLPYLKAEDLELHSRSSTAPRESDQRMRRCGNRMRLVCVVFEAVFRRLARQRFDRRRYVESNRLRTAASGVYQSRSRKARRRSGSSSRRLAGSEPIIRDFAQLIIDDRSIEIAVLGMLLVALLDQPRAEIVVNRLRIAGIRDSAQ